MSDLVSGKVPVSGGLNVPPLFVIAKEKKKNHDTSVAITVSTIPASSLDGASLMGAVTGIPFAVGLKMLCEGKITRRGVLAP
jgi:saccharopine dehydrogenase-like NADP-dependent oxidoreductase